MKSNHEDRSYHMRERASAVTVSVSKGRLQVSHPWLIARNINLSTASMDDVAAAVFKRDLERLLSAAPLRKADVPADMPSNIEAAYWRYMPEETKRPPISAAAMRDIERRIKAPQSALQEQLAKADNRIDRLTHPESAFELLRQRSEELETVTRERDNARAEVADLKMRLEAVTGAVGERSKREKQTTLQDAFDHWSGKQLRCAEPDKMVGRCRAVLVELDDGLGTHYGDLTLAMLQQALADSRRYGKNATNAKALTPLSDGERNDRANAVRRFFSDICRPTHEGGLAFKMNPAEKLKWTSKTRREDPPFLSPRDCTALPIQWRALTAIMGYSGARLSEAASLTWERIDREKKILELLPTEEKPEMKNERSYRAVQPFADLWPILEEYQKTTCKHGLLFTKLDGSSWFEDGKLTSLSSRLEEACKDAGINVPERARRLRRYWESAMRAAGLLAELDIMSGHDKAVGLKNYTNRLAVARAAKIGEAPDIQA